jgi:hypothetical protein
MSLTFRLLGQRRSWQQSPCRRAGSRPSPFSGWQEPANGKGDCEKAAYVLQYTRQLIGVQLPLSPSPIKRGKQADLRLVQANADDRFP